jgi:hypothetical protein
MKRIIFILFLLFAHVAEAQRYLNSSNDSVDVGANTAGLATSANQLANSHDVTVDNASGGAAVNIQDGGNVITVDGTELSNIDTNTTNLDNTHGTDGAVGPSRALSVAGTEAGGNLQELRVDSDGHPQIDVLTGGGGTEFAEDSGHSSGDNGSLPLVVRQTAATDLSAGGTDGDYVPLQVDANGALRVTGGGGGTEYVEDAVAPSNPTAAALNLRREDAPVLEGADGDWVAQRATGYGAAYTQILDSSGNFIDTFGGSGGTASTDEAVFTAGTTQGTPTMCAVDETTPDSTGEDDVGIVRMSANRNMYINIRDAAGNERGMNVNASNEGLVLESNSAAILADTAAIDTATGNIDTQTANLQNTHGTDGAAGPSRALSIAGTQSGGNLQEIEVDASGQLQIDIVGNNTDFATQTTLATIDTDTGNIDTNTTDIPNVIGTDAAAGPTRAVSIGGTEAGGNFQEVLVDSDGHFQVDILSGGGSNASVFVDDADWTDGTSSHTLTGGIYQTTPQSITDGDTGPIQVDVNGNIIESNSTAILADTAAIDTATGNIDTQTANLQNTHGTDGATGPSRALSIAGTEGGGNLQEIAVDSTGNLQVDIVADAAGLATSANQLADNHNVTANAGTGDFLSISAHTENESLKEATAIAGELDDTATTAATEDNVASARITAQRGVHVNLRNNAGTETGTAGEPLRVDPTGSTTQPVSGTVTADAGSGTFTVDASNVTGTDGAAGPASVLSVGGTQGTGEIEELRVDGDGHLQVDILSGGGSNASVYVDDADWTDNTSSHTLTGGIYQTTPQSITDGDTGPMQVDVNGNIIESNSAAILSDTTAILADTAAIDTATGNIDTQTANLQNTHGTDGAAGPTRALSIAGTESGGNLQEIAVDATGNVQVDIVADAAGLATSANQLADGHNVTIDNAAGASAVNIQDGGNVITVNGTVTADAGTGFPTAYTEDVAAPADPDGNTCLLVRDDAPVAIAADGDWVVHKATQYGAAYTQIVDSSGSFVDTFGGGTEYTEDAVAATDPVGNAQILVSDTTPALEVAEGDNVARRATRYGAAYTQILDSSGNFIDTFGGSGGTAQNDNTTFTGGSTSHTPVGAIYDTTPPTITDGNVGAFRMDANRMLFAHLVDSDGNTLTDTTFDALTIIGHETDGTTVGASPNVSIPGLVFDDVSPVTVTEGEVGYQRMSATRDAYTTIRDAAGNERGVNVNASNELLVASTSDLATVAGTATSVNQGSTDAGTQRVVNSFASANGTLTGASQSVTLDVSGLAGAAIQLTGTWTATVGFDATVDGTNWTDLGVYVLTESSSTVTTATGNGIWSVNVGGFNQIRAFTDAYTSGTVTVDIEASVGPAQRNKLEAVSVGTFPDNEPFNMAQINGTTPSMNTGNAAVGTQRVVLASDQPVVEIEGDVDDDAVDAAGNNPVKLGAVAKEADGTDPGSVSAENDIVELTADRNRRLLVNTVHPDWFTVSENHSTPQTDNELVADPGNNFQICVTDIIFSNGATAGSLKLVRTTATAVDVFEEIYAPVNGGAVVPLRTPLCITASENLGFTSTSVTTHSITVQGYVQASP